VQVVSWLVAVDIGGLDGTKVGLMGVALGVALSIAAILVGGYTWTRGRRARLGVLLGVVGLIANPVSLYLASLAINGTGDLRR
jgi:hypothetical protein